MITKTARERTAGAGTLATSVRIEPSSEAIGGAPALGGSSVIARDQLSARPA
jgi:hypothetical protein